MKDYQILASLWEKWIPANQMKTFLRSGSYYLRKDGITFIVLNTNYYSFKNDKNSNDCGQMEWLKETLEREKRFGNKYFYFIVYHIFYYVIIVEIIIF